MQDELREMRKAEPFFPFTIGKRDGTGVTVKDAEYAALMKHWIYVATEGGETAEHLYLLHITRLSSSQKEAT